MCDGALSRSTHVPSFAEYFYGDESMTIIVYSTPTCVQSRATTHALEARGIAFEEIDLTQDNEAHRAIEAMGYSQGTVDKLAQIEGIGQKMAGFIVEYIILGDDKSMLTSGAGAWNKAIGILEANF